MRLITTAPLATAVSSAGGIGFLGAGTDASTLDAVLEESSGTLAKGTFANGYNWRGTQDGLLPVGVGFLLWGFEDDTYRQRVLPSLKKHRPCALWLFAPRGDDCDAPEWRAQLRLWAESTIEEVPDCRIWIQISSVKEARRVVEDEVLGKVVDVLVVQGADAGGHGLVNGAGLMSLLPEIYNVAMESSKTEGREMPQVVAAGGLSTGVQVAATMMLGADGVCLGTRFLATPEANVPEGYKKELVRADDGGQTTVRSGVYDYLRGTRGWPKGYGGRGVMNKTFEEWTEGKLGPGSGVGVNGLSTGHIEEDVQRGRDELEKAYKEAESKAKTDEDGVWGPSGRMCTYAGTGVGLVRKVMPAADVVREVQEDYASCIRKVRS